MSRLLHGIWTLALWIFDQLPGVVAFLIAAFGVAIIYMNELQAGLKDKRRARWLIAVVLVLFGVGAFISDTTQKNQDKAELEAERNSAREDRKMFLQQTNQLLTFAQSQATKDDLKQLGIDILNGLSKVESAIRGKPPKAILPPALPPPTVEHTRFTTRRAPSSDPAAPYGLQVIIQSDITISPVDFGIECTGEVSSVTSFLTGQGVYMSVYNGAAPNNKNVAVVRFTFPPMEPSTPLVVTILSKEDIRVKQIIRYPQ
jgi:hypothetical protein